MRSHCQKQISSLCDALSHYALLWLASSNQRFFVAFHFRPFIQVLGKDICRRSCSRSWGMRPRRCNRFRSTEAGSSLGESPSILINKPRWRKCLRELPFVQLNMGLLSLLPLYIWTKCWIFLNNNTHEVEITHAMLSLSLASLGSRLLDWKSVSDKLC